MISFVGQSAESDVEALVRTRADLATGSRGLGDGVGDGAVVRLDGRLELVAGDLDGEAALRTDERTKRGARVWESSRCHKRWSRPPAPEGPLRTDPWNGD